MLLEALIALSVLVPGLQSGADAVATRLSLPRCLGPCASRDGLSEPHFSPVARAVSNWRLQAGATLFPTSLALVARYAEADPAFVSRCVKLNNYWCIKQARWSGELGGDDERHTAFASASDGADAAALLLRRYYRELGRRSASAIVRRWAPAECGIVRPLPGPTRIASAQPRVSSDVAPRGLGTTLRARYLARRAPSRVAMSAGRDLGLRVQPWSARARLAGRPARIAARPLPSIKVPDIATGIGGASSPGPTNPPAARTGIASSSLARTSPRSAGSRPAPRPAATTIARGAENPAALLSQDRLVAEAAALPSIVAGLPGGRLLDLRVPAPLCSNDEVRIRNYANRIAESVGLKADDDLGLFLQDGSPTERLAPVMLAMSRVELGALRASPTLVAEAIERLRTRFASTAASVD